MEYARALGGFYKRCCRCVRAGGSHIDHITGANDIPTLDFDRVDQALIGGNFGAPTIFPTRMFLKFSLYST